MTNTDLDSGENDTSRYGIHKSYHSRMILYIRIRYDHLQEGIKAMKKFLSRLKLSSTGFLENMFSENIFEKRLWVHFCMILLSENSITIWRSEYEGFVIAITHFDQ